MAKIVIEKWRCDICEKELVSEKQIQKTNVPSYAGTDSEFFVENSLDLCQECAAKLREAISKHFVHIVDNYGKLTISKPQ